MKKIFLFKKKRIFNRIYIKSKKVYEWVGYIEMNTETILFNYVIRLYVQGDGQFELYNEFSNDIISSDYRHYEIIKL